MEYSNIKYIGKNSINEDFHNTILDSVNFEQSMLEKLDFNLSDIKKTNFISSVLTRANFDKTKMLFTNFENSNLQYLSIKNSELIFCCFSYADLQDIDFSYSDLNRSDFYYANLINANFCSADLTYASFSNSNLRKANFRNANLHHSNLRYCDLSEVDFGNADLKHVHFEKSINISNANFKGAKIFESDTETLSFLGKRRIKDAIIIPYIQPKHVKINLDLELCPSKVYKFEDSKYNTGDITPKDIFHIKLFPEFFYDYVSYRFVLKCSNRFILNELKFPNQLTALIKKTESLMEFSDDDSSNGNIILKIFFNDYRKISQIVMRINKAGLEIHFNTDVLPEIKFN